MTAHVSTSHDLSMRRLPVSRQQLLQRLRTVRLGEESRSERDESGRQRSHTFEKASDTVRVPQCVQVLKEKGGRREGAQAWRARFSCISRDDVDLTKLIKASGSTTAAALSEKFNPETFSAGSNQFETNSRTISLKTARERSCLWVPENILRLGIRMQVLRSTGRKIYARAAVRAGRRRT